MKQISWPLKANWINTLSIVPRCCHFWCKQKKIGSVVLPADRVRISWKLFWALWSSSPSCVHLRLTRATECWWSFLTSTKTKREHHISNAGLRHANSQYSPFQPPFKPPKLSLLMCVPLPTPFAALLTFLYLFFIVSCFQSTFYVGLCVL